MSKNLSNYFCQLLSMISHWSVIGAGQCFALTFNYNGGNKTTECLCVFQRLCYLLKVSRLLFENLKPLILLF